jgi:DNA-binding PadR family transcriptional regulator
MSKATADKSDGTDLSNGDSEQPVIDQLKAAIRGPDAQCGNSPVAVIAYAERQSTADYREAADALKQLLNRGDVVRTERGLQLVETDGGVAEGDSTDSTHPTSCTRFQLDQLAAIAHLEATDTVCSGAAIREHLEPYLDEEIQPARIYQNLDDLVDAGLLERTQHDGRTYEYTLTTAGRACLYECIQWLADQAGLRVVDGDRDHDGDAPDTHPDGGATIRTDGGRDRVHRRDAVVDRVLSRFRPNPSTQISVDSGDGAETDGGRNGEFCAACTHRVARDERTTHDGLVYHQQCAPDKAECHADGGEIETDWRLTCLDCDFEQELTTASHPRDGPPDIVRDRVTTHKHATDESHIVRVAGRRADHDRGGDDTPDPSLLTDGGPTALTETPVTRVEAERRARQAARALDQWSRVARLDLLTILQAETPVQLPVDTERLTMSTGGLE